MADKKETVQTVKPAKPLLLMLLEEKKLIREAVRAGRPASSVKNFMPDGKS